MKKISYMKIFIVCLFSLHQFNCVAQIPKEAKIFVAGHKGLVGNAIVRQLKDQGYNNIITRGSSELDLRRQEEVEKFFAQEHPDYVFLAAAKVGGIWANMKSPADFIRDNLAIEVNVISAAHAAGVKKLLFLGSSCIYPRMAPQPMKEEHLLSGPLETTNEWYAIAKIAGIKLCQAFNKQYGTKYISCMPTNLYGPHDNFNIEMGHAMPALIAKMVQAKKAGDKQVVVWGTGSPKREFLYVDDLAQACLFLMNNYEGDEIVNVGVGEDISLKDLAFKIKNAVGFEGELVFDTTKPDGTPRKLLNVDALKKLGWQASTDLDTGIKKTLAWYLQNYEKAKK
jgi:GDP-L-fucose synthase